MNTAWNPRSQGPSPKASSAASRSRERTDSARWRTPAPRASGLARERGRDPEVSQRGADDLLELGAGRLGDAAEVEVGGDDAPDDGVELFGDGAAHGGLELPGDARGPGRRCTPITPSNGR